MSATSGAGTAYTSEVPEFIPVFSGVRVTRVLALCVCFVDRFCPFLLFLLVIVLSVLRFTDSDYPFDIFKLFLLNKSEHCQLYHDGNTRMMMLVFWFTLSWVFIEVDH